ncbi:hypothetical protein BJ322DRAFT_1081870 [Thelephora terrestris]|uniref:Uncharacterized protein n=1 Tax=Thelephora terrestris TaxID=56493 RepID=A0A9P6H943_9AGAM|nr:hypothetical protein BJ322DRAFT_1081870 [Thelephora terrestris]
MMSSESLTDSTSGSTPTDVRFLRKLANVIAYAHVHCRDESKTYAILNVLLTPYVDLFFSKDPGISIFITPQDKLVGPEEMRVAPNKNVVRVIPDMTVKITRGDLYDEERSHGHLVLVIEAKRLCVDTSTGDLFLLVQIDVSGLSTVSGLSPWYDIEAGKRISADAFDQHLGQLMLQSWCSCNASPTQQQIYLMLLTGPFITVLKFSRPPGTLPGLFTEPTMGQEDSSRPTKRRRAEEEEDVQEKPSLHDLVPRKYAPVLIIWNRHILADPLDCTQGLSVALRHALHCVTEDLIEGFDQGVQMVQSSVFDFTEFGDHPFKETKDAQDGFDVAVTWWYEESERSGRHFDYAAAAEEKDKADRQKEVLASKSPDRLHYHEGYVYTATGERILTPSTDGSVYIPSPEKSKQRGRTSSPPSSPSPAPDIGLPRGSLISYSTRYQRSKGSKPQ